MSDYKLSEEEKMVLKKAIEARDKFLEQHPHLIPLQQKIDQILEKVGPDPLLRSSAIHILMMAKLQNELVPEMKILEQKVKDVLDPLSKISQDSVKKKTG